MPRNKGKHNGTEAEISRRGVGIVAAFCLRHFAMLPPCRFTLPLRHVTIERAQTDSSSIIPRRLLVELPIVVTSSPTLPYGGSPAGTATSMRAIRCQRHDTDAAERAMLLFRRTRVTLLMPRHFDIAADSLSLFMPH